LFGQSVVEECRRIVDATPPAPRQNIFKIFVLTRRAFSRTRTATPSTSRA
jgi:hypothetical protein